LPRLEVRGLPIDPGGAGYVIIRTTKSAVGPHRLRPTLECYRHSAARSQKMTMREIQDHTLAMARGTDQIEAKYDGLRQLFAVGMGRSIVEPESLGRLGMRVTAVPAQTDVAVEKVHGIAKIQPSVGEWMLSGPAIQQQLLSHPAPSSMWRLVLRGRNDASRSMPQVVGYTLAALGSHSRRTRRNRGRKCKMPRRTRLALSASRSVIGGAFFHRMVPTGRGLQCCG